jgi:hypothetical protein
VVWCGDGRCGARRGLAVPRAVVTRGVVVRVAVSAWMDH